MCKTVRSVVAADSTLITTARGPVLLDEWQRLPEVWDVVRRQVDRSPGAPGFLLSGSATPTEGPIHSGAGRIITLRMRPLSLYERQLTGEHVSLSALLSGTKPTITGTSYVSLRDYVREIASSGFPAIRGRNVDEHCLQPHPRRCHPRRGREAGPLHFRVISFGAHSALDPRPPPGLDANRLISQAAGSLPNPSSDGPCACPALAGAFRGLVAAWRGGRSAVAT